ncbi:MAG: tetratricopeptide repeat-containing sulfotransferase family protein [Brevirhabdus sp.]
MIPINPSQIPGLYKQAMQRLGKGDLDGAQTILSQVLLANRRIPEVHFQLGRISAEKGRFDQSVKYFETALALKPSEAAIWTQLADALVRLGDRDRSADFLARAKSAGLDPKLVIALQDKLNKKTSKTKASIGAADPAQIKAAIAALNGGNAAKAEQIAARLRSQHPDVAIIADILASAQTSLGRTDAALASYEAATRLDPNYAEAFSNYGRLLSELGRVDEAILKLRHAHELVPDAPVTRLHLGVALRRAGEVEEAVNLLARLTKSHPSMADAWEELGAAQMDLGDHAAALEALEHARALGRDEARQLTRMGICHAALDHEDRAMEMFDAAIAKSPDLAHPYARKASLLQTQGDFDGAEALFAEAMKRAPETGEFYQMFVTSRKMTEDHPLIPRMEEIWQSETLSDKDRSDLGFALSKTMEDIKADDRAFPYLKTANDLVRKAYPYDVRTRRQELIELRAALDGVDFQAEQVAGASEYAPIFVTGMPRSGTTLVEQIISSHSQVSGAGELGFLARDAYKLLSGKGSGRMFRPLASVPNTQIAELGQLYETHLRADFPNAPRITDKSIQTYTVMGLAKLALPNARFIVVRRDPRDNLLSIYRNQFATGKHLYAYDLADLGHYYRYFEEHIEYWREKMPGAFYEIQYEALIDDPEGEARKLIDACGLEWEDACLSFHENKRSVKTLSVYQVRQPIYKSSMKAWQRYEKELGPMFEALNAKD